MALFGVPTTLSQYQAQKSGAATGVYNQPLPAGLKEYLDSYNAPPTDQIDYTAPDGGVDTIDAAAAPFRPQLANDPAWLAYLNSLGLERNQFEADIARRRGVATADLARQYAQLQQEGKYQRERVTGGLESAGFGRSGVLEQSLARQRAGQASAAGGIYANAANQLSALETELASKIADLGQQQAGQELTLRTQGFV